MPDTLVVCGGLSAPKRRRAEVLELNTAPDAPGDRRVLLQFENLAARLVDNPDPLLLDAVEIASYVFTADRQTKRGTSRMDRMGADWRRRLYFEIPVRKPEVWQSPEMNQALVDVLSFLSEDEFVFKFERSISETLNEPFLGFDEPGAQTIRPDDVILFSGGLDSLAGAAQQVLGANRSAVLVTHKNSTNIAKRQDELFAALTERSGKRLFHAPVWVKKGNYEPVEHTQRTRSFLFVSLGAIVAGLFKRDEVHFFENGVTSFNLPIAEHVIGARASRTTHPRVLAGFSRLFSLLLQRDFKVTNRFLWHTKADVVGVIKEHGCADLIAQTTSCANIRNLAMTTRQCGVCSQCIERRFAILATGLTKEDPADAYEVELFTGTHTKAEDLTMVEQYVARAHRLASLSESAFLASYGQVFRTLPCLGGSASLGATKVYELHRRYAAGIVDVVNSELRARAGLDHALALPATSLLAMINAPMGAAPIFKDPFELESLASEQAAARSDPVKDRRIAFAIDRTKRTVLFDYGLKLDGVSYELIVRLTDQFVADKNERKPPERCAFIATQKLLGDLGVVDHTLLQRVRRVRKVLESHFVAAIDYVIDQEDIIQSKRWSGYRLNPYLTLVEPSELRLP